MSCCYEIRKQWNVPLFHFQSHSVSAVRVRSRSTKRCVLKVWISGRNLVLTPTIKWRRKTDCSAHSGTVVDETDAAHITTQWYQNLQFWSNYKQGFCINIVEIICRSKKHSEKEEEDKPSSSTKKKRKKKSSKSSTPNSLQVRIALSYIISVNKFIQNG